MTTSRLSTFLAILAWPFQFLWINLRMWAGLLARPIGAAYEAGELLAVRRPLDTIVLTHWRAPYTDGVRCRLPTGTRLRVADDTGRFAKGLTCRPDDPESFERRFIPATQREHPKYAGCSLVLSRRELEACERLADPSCPPG